MKKIYSIFITFAILMLISSTVFASDYGNDENKKRENAIKMALDSYMQTFMTEETPEEDRIKDYIYTGYGMSEQRENDDKLYVNISFIVTPVNEDNTTWNKHGDICFASFSKVDGEYVSYKISGYPDNYDKFLERFEEYKKNNTETKEITQVQGEEMINKLAGEEIEKMSNIIYISCSIILLVMICFIIIKLIKKSKYKTNN